MLRKKILNYIYTKFERIGHPNSSWLVNVKSLLVLFALPFNTLVFIFGILAYWGISPIKVNDDEYIGSESIIHSIEAIVFVFILSVALSTCFYIQSKLKKRKQIRKFANK